MKKSGRIFAAFALSLTLALPANLTVEAKAKVQESQYYQEDFRNQYHFSPEANWMNDPNGMVYYQGEYHLFYQHHPYATTNGPIHWGHAVSKDLIHWEHLPIALPPDENGLIFSGSAVIDWNNTAGFGKEAMVAIFTHASGPRQVQSIAYSNDKGRTWTKYEGNPVMPNPPQFDWRDPKVFWHEESSQWVMLLAADNKVMLYSSPDLKVWNHESDFGVDGGIQGNAAQSASSSAISAQKGGSFTYEGEVILVEFNGRKGSGGFVFRSDSEMRNGYVAVLDPENDVVSLRLLQEGIETELASTSMELDIDIQYRMKVETNGSKIKVFLNDQLVIELEDSTLESGHYGLTTWNSNSVFRNMKFNNTSNVVTNLNGWSSVTGTWEDTLDGKQGSSDGEAYTMSKNSADTFSYESNIKIFADSGDGGAASLVFRADPEAKNGYAVSIDDASNKLILVKLVDGVSTVIAESDADIEPDKSYHLKISAAGTDIKVYLDGNQALAAADPTYTDGLLGLHTSNLSAVFQNIQKTKLIITDAADIENHDFETGDLSGWTIARGNAFTNEHVSEATSYWGGPFGHQGNSHMWGAAVPPYDESIGELHSSPFKLSGSGEINLMLGGGNDLKSRYAALVRASDDKELIRQENKLWADDEKYRKYVWDASPYLGEVFYIKVVDISTGGWGHINVDDVNVNNTGPMPDAVDQIAAEPEEPELFQSGALTDWNGVTGQWVPSTYGRYAGFWECPALFTLPVDENPDNKQWVLQVSLQNGSAAGGAGMMYFVGDFDGNSFQSDNTPDKVLWSDYGGDFYAGVE